MDTVSLNSIAVPTLLMAVGLFFFIRASVKDRTEVLSLASDRPPESLSRQLKDYLCERSYRVAGFDPEQNCVTFEGKVRASWFLAIFLSFLAAIGFLCVALVLATLIPRLSQGIIALVFLSPLAGVFYWQRANRREQVLVTVKDEEKTSPMRNAEGSLATIVGHRDELAALQRAMPDLQPTSMAE
ncbi:cofactor assembly of complex C subunit B [Geitlerinema sp. P-1104]|uniref:cofactor assembly of complex C subunit B n=1 Tax=Geitlerinema sp. P-1104 TaxID=2546230 RepID=UPI0014771760|nr:cofactor assembly of complex C subunit B [Geitlerinema sp. P-1104]NMG57725.1 cofactor assembly of complex C subunit B [Geitlerinema sp. P-1104]